MAKRLIRLRSEDDRGDRMSGGGLPGRRGSQHRQRSRRAGPGIVVSVAESPRVKAGRASYHEIDFERFEKREGVVRIQDQGCDEWAHKVSVILSPEKDCHHGELVREVVARVEQRTGERVEWSAWSHRDTAQPHAHLILRTGELSDRGFAKMERTIQDAARDGYQTVRDRQRAYAKERDRNRGMER